MGFLKSIGHAVKKTVKAGVAAAKRAPKIIANPVKATKQLLHNPAEFITKMVGFDKILSEPKVNALSEEPALTTAETSADQDTQDRQRMVTRQGNQSVLPMLLLGQDYVPTSLAKDEELGGKGR